MRTNFSTENLRTVFAEEGKFENFRRLCSDLTQGNKLFTYDDAGNRVEISKRDANKAIQKVFMQVCGLTEEDLKSPKRVKRAVKNHHQEIFEIIEEDIELKTNTGLSQSEWFNAFVDYRNVALGDEEEFEIKVQNTLFVVAEVSGDHHDLTLQNLPRGTRTRVHVKRYGIKVGKDIDLVVLGRVDYTALTDKIAESFIHDIQDKAYTAMYGAAASIPIPSQFNKTGALDSSTKNAFDELLEDVASINNAEVYIVGTKMALKNLNHLASDNRTVWVSDSMKESVANTGVIGSYEGTTLLEIPQRFKLNDLTGKIYSNKVLFVFAKVDDKFIKVTDKGEVEIVEVTEKGQLNDDFMTYEVQRSYGAGVQIGQYFGVWNITP